MSYIHKILKTYPLLTPYQQFELSKKINRLVLIEEQAIDWILKFDCYPTKAELATANGISVSELEDICYEGVVARDDMILSNLRLVSWIAIKYQNKNVKFQDLFQEGVFGLITAVNQYDPHLGYRFSSYASYYIRKQIQTAYFNNCRTIRLPINIYQKISKMYKITNDLQQELHRKPTDNDIARSMCLSTKELMNLKIWNQKVISLENLDVEVIQSDQEAPEDILIKNLLCEGLEKVINTLSHRERDVLRLRYGLDDGCMKTLKEIGQIFNVTGEWIRQIEAKALCKLRHPSRRKVLKEYLNYID
ncbi:RNA polymerase sigma factor [Nostoc sp. NIES-2111]|nr:RNA polymerase sigma factor [Nostoc sp. NIES-2111]